MGLRSILELLSEMSPFWVGQKFNISSIKCPLASQPFTFSKVPRWISWRLLSPFPNFLPESFSLINCSINFSCLHNPEWITCTSLVRHLLHLGYTFLCYDKKRAQSRKPGQPWDPLPSFHFSQELQYCTAYFLGPKWLSLCFFHPYNCFCQESKSSTLSWPELKVYSKTYVVLRASCFESKLSCFCACSL